MIAIPIRPRAGRSRAAPGAEPPLHVHDREDETIYMLEGRIDVFVEGTWHNLVPGESIFMPGGVPHTFRIRSSEARAVTVITPGGFKSWFRVLGRPAHIFGIPDKILPPTEEDFVRMLELGERMGVRLIPEGGAF